MYSPITQRKVDPNGELRTLRLTDFDSGICILWMPKQDSMFVEFPNTRGDFVEGTTEDMWDVREFNFGKDGVSLYDRIKNLENLSQLLNHIFNERRLYQEASATAKTGDFQPMTEKEGETYGADKDPT